MRRLAGLLLLGLAAAPRVAPRAPQPALAPAPQRPPPPPLPRQWPVLHGQRLTGAAAAAAAAAASQQPPGLSGAAASQRPPGVAASQRPPGPAGAAAASQRPPGPPGTAAASQRPPGLLATAAASQQQWPARHGRGLSEAAAAAAAGGSEVLVSYRVGARVPRRGPPPLVGLTEEEIIGFWLRNASVKLGEVGLGWPGCDAEVSPPSPPGPPAAPPRVPAIPSPPPEGLFALGEGQDVACNPGLEDLGEGQCVPCRAGHWCRGGKPIRCEPGTYNPFTYADRKENCSACPKAGVECVTGDSFTVLQGFYLIARPGVAQGEKAYKCAQKHACVGGNSTGDTGCEEGNWGPLCGQCSKGYYRGKRMCKACPSKAAEDKAAAANGTSSNSSSMRGGSGTRTAASGSAASGALISGNAMSMLVMASAVLGFSCMLIVFLRQPDFSGMMPRKLKGLSNAASSSKLPRQAAIASTMLKVFISYCQCLGAVRGFTRIAWPISFDAFMEILDVFNFELFEMVPAECLADTRMGFRFELVAVLSMPIFAILFVLLLARLSVIGLKGKRWDGKLATIFTQSRVFKLTTWLLLFIYPTIAKKSLATFDCMEFGTISLLRADPGEECFVSSWLPWAGISGAGALLYCIGGPLLAWWASHRWAQSEQRELRERVALLVTSYRPECYYMESIDLLRKFLLTGVVLVVLPETRAQIWFGIIITLISFIYYVRVQPYAEQICGRIQAAAMLQLLFTYISAILFFDDGGEPYSSNDDALGIGLILANSGCFFVLAAYVMAGITSSAKKVSELRLVYAADKAAVRLGPPLAHARQGTPAKGSPLIITGFHCYLSHQWTVAQDLAGATKSLLRTMVPSIQVCLDVDDLTDGRTAESCVAASDVVVVFLTIGYLSSDSCRRELRQALRLNKPLMLIRETDPNHGGITLEGLEAEFELLKVRGQLEAEEEKDIGKLLAEVPTALEWHREKAFKYTVLKSIVTRVYMQQPRMRGMKLKDAPPMSMRDDAKRPAGISGAIVALSDLYMDVPPSVEGVGYKSMHEEVKDQLAKLGVSCQDVEGAPTILLLHPEVFRNQALMDEISLILTPRKLNSKGLLTRPNAAEQKALARGSEAAGRGTRSGALRATTDILPIASTAVTFDRYLAACPPQLKSKGLFKLFFEKWPESPLLQEVAAIKLAQKLQKKLKSKKDKLGITLQPVQRQMTPKATLAAKVQLVAQANRMNKMKRFASDSSLAAEASETRGTERASTEAASTRRSSEAAPVEESPAAAPEAEGRRTRQLSSLWGGGLANGRRRSSAASRTSSVSDAQEDAERAAPRISVYDKKLDALPAVVWSKLSLTGLLGNGSTGRVYLSLYHDKQVAVRRLTPHVCSLYRDDELRHEVQKLSSLRHRNLLGVYAIILEQQRPSGILLELAPRSLTGLLSELPEGTALISDDAPTAITIIKQVALGIGFLHSKSVLHGSLSPANVLLGADRVRGGVTLPGRVKLADYGRPPPVLLDALSEARAKDSTLASAGDAADRLPYTAPELIVGTSWSNKADVYSLGCLLARVCSPRPLFTAAAADGACSRPPWELVFSRIVDGEARPTDLMVPEAPRSAHLLAEACVVAEASKRPTAAGALKTLTKIAVGLDLEVQKAAGGCANLALKPQMLPAPGFASASGLPPPAARGAGRSTCGSSAEGGMEKGGMERHFTWQNNESDLHAHQLPAPPGIMADDRRTADRLTATQRRLTDRLTATQSGMPRQVSWKGGEGASTSRAEAPRRQVSWKGSEGKGSEGGGGLPDGRARATGRSTPSPPKQSPPTSPPRTRLPRQSCLAAGVGSNEALNPALRAATARAVARGAVETASERQISAGSRNKVRI